MDKAAFRENFPEFSDITTYPDSQLDFWGGFAERNISECRWGEDKPLGVALFVAHQLVLYKQDMESAENGGTPGQFLGAATSKAVGDVSVGYDANMSMEPNAGHWNLTTYGKQFIRLLRFFGMGAIQL